MLIQDVELRADADRDGAVEGRAPARVFNLGADRVPFVFEPVGADAPARISRRAAGR